MTINTITQTTKMKIETHRYPRGLNLSANPQSAIRNPQSSGFTLVEIMLVVAIIGILAALVVPKIAGNAERARVTAVQSDINGGIKTSLGEYEVDMGFYPQSLQDL